MRGAIVLVWLLLVSGAAWAAEGEATPRHDPRSAFAETDANHDGKIDRQEFHERMVEIFFHGDRDKNGFMTWQELEAVVVFPEDFRGADRDGDERISLYEFIRVRFEDFDPVDGDDDGLLSLEEIVAVFERGGVR
jgi:Ca2+-binding EF-hand superfamily protein